MVNDRRYQAFSALCFAALAGCSPASLTPSNAGPGGTPAAAQGITVRIQPEAIEINSRDTVTFSVSVYGTADDRVAWQLDPGGGGIDDGGHYTAPATPGVYHAVASSIVDASASAVAVITVAAPGGGAAPGPAISSFSASPASISAGQTTTLSWSATGATALSIDQGVGSVAGSSTVVRPTATTTYTLTARNSAGSVSASTVVAVSQTGPPPSPGRRTAYGAFANFDSTNGLVPIRLWPDDGFDPSLAAQYGLLWAANKNSWQTAAAANSRYHAAKPSLVLGKYMPMYRSDSQDGAHTFGWFKSNHRDWIVYQCDRVTPAYEYGYTCGGDGAACNLPLDITNPAVVAFQVQTYGQGARAQGFDAISVDNFEGMGNGFGRCGHFDASGAWVDLYGADTSGAKFKEDALAWLKAFRDGLHALSPPVGMIVNWIPAAGQKQVDDATRNRIVANVDAILDEGAIPRDGKRLETDSLWSYLIRTAKYAQSQGVPYIWDGALGSGSGTSSAAFDYVVGSYMIANDGQSGMNINDSWYGTEFTAAGSIGAPCGPHTQTGTLYSRDFVHGAVAVNSSSSGSARYELPSGSWKDLRGGSVSAGSKTLSPATALVVTTSATRCTP